MSMTRVALLSNPRSTGNRSLLPRVRSYCAEHAEIFHYEVEAIEQIGEALRTIARVQPRVLVINGGDGTVQATLTELYHGGHFGENIPPVAVLPNGKTNLIALDLGAVGDPLGALDRILELARDEAFDSHLVTRELIALTNGVVQDRPVLGMFLGGAGLADTILYCRHKVYPLGLPNGISHLITAIAVFVSLIFRPRLAFLPPRPAPVKVSLLRQGQLQGRFALLIVTTLHKMLLGSGTVPQYETNGRLKLMLVEQSPIALFRAVLAGISGKLGQRTRGIHVEMGDEIRIESDRSSVILDGELFEATRDHPIILTPTAPVPFLKLAA